MSWNLADAKNRQSAQKLSYTRNLRWNAFKGKYFMAVWFFKKVVWFVLAALLEGILLPSSMAAKTTFCLYLVKHLIVTLICAVKVTTSSFQHFPWSLVQTLCFGHVTSYELTHFKKMVRVWKTKSLLFCLRWPTNRLSKAKSYNYHFYKTMWHDLLLQMAYSL